MALTWQQIDAAKACLAKIEAFDLEAAIVQNFPNQDLGKTCLGRWNAIEFQSLSKRMTRQLAAQFDGPSPNVLPHCFWWDVQGQSMEQRHLDGTLSEYLLRLENQHWERAADLLEVLIGYQVHCGFWSVGERKLYSIPRLKQFEIFKTLELKSSQLTQLINEVSGKNQQLEPEIENRKTEAAAIGKLLHGAERETEEVGKLLNQASNHEGKLQQIVSNQEANLETSKNEIQEATKIKIDLLNSLKSAIEELEKSRAILQFLESKVDMVNEIAGTAGAGLLGRKFEARNWELQSTSRTWFYILLGSVGASAVWLGFAHKYIVQKDPSIWMTLAENFGLLLPACFLLYFVANQYAKERHFQEEYAFRSAVSMTLNAFADLLKEGQSERNKLYTDTVERLYRLPISLQERESGAGLFRSKPIEQTTKSLLELIKEINELKKHDK